MSSPSFPVLTVLSTRTSSSDSRMKFRPPPRNRQSRLLWTSSHTWRLRRRRVKQPSLALHTISETWLDLDRYLQVSEVHLSDARAHFSQLLRDPSSTKLSFNPLPAYQPHRSHRSALRAPVAASQTHGGALLLWLPDHDGEYPFGNILPPHRCLYQGPITARASFRCC